jgi:methyl-accepting chemotaxis protein
MLKLFGTSRIDPAAAMAAANDSQPVIDGREIVQTIYEQASGVGREAAEVRGFIDDAQKVAARQAEAVMTLAQQLQQVTQAQDDIHSQTDDSRGSVARARDAVQDVSDGVSGVIDTLHEVSEAAGQIAQIALQTRLVAFNASVEAKRAGEAGRGFGVVADAVKELAGKVETSSKDIMRTISALDTRIAALAREIQSQPDHGDGAGGQQGAFHRALAEVEDGVTRIQDAAAKSREICGGLNRQMSTIEGEMKQTGRMLDAALERSESFLKVSEGLIEIVAQCGIETEDAPYIRAAQEGAAQIARLLEDALRTGVITERDLYDENYRPIEGTNPQQHLTRFVELTDRLFPQVQERLLGLSPKVVFCIAADRNGYIATHNRKYSQPQRGDLAWDAANSRYRRIFNDRTGLASARNTRPFLLQTYRRDMGGGNFVVMKEAAAPITVNGRHWGGLRLAFHF